MLVLFSAECTLLAQDFKGKKAVLSRDLVEGLVVGVSEALELGKPRPCTLPAANPERGGTPYIKTSGD